MKCFETTFRQRKNVIKEYENMSLKRPMIWMLVDFARRPMEGLECGLWYLLRVYNESLSCQLSPLNAVVVSEKELKEYFEEIVL